MFKQKYKKYKSKYLKLKNSIMSGGVGVQEVDMSDATKNIVNIDKLVDGDDSNPSQDIPRPDLPEIESDDQIIKPTEEIKEESVRNIELGNSGVTGKVEPKNKLADIEDIKEINSIDDFDKFTEKYTNNNVIDWNKVKKKYKGIYINPAIKIERYELMPDGTDTKPSWWKLDFIDYVGDDEAVIFN